MPPHKDKFSQIASLVNNVENERAFSQKEVLSFVEKLKDVTPSESSLSIGAKRYYRRNEEGEIVEDWQGMLKRVARDIATDSAGQVGEELSFIFFKVMQAGLFFPNSPTLMNAGTPVQQLQACFVLPIEDSMESIFETLKHSALIQKSGGGIGYFIGNMRPKGAIVKSTGGEASGPLSFLSVYNKVSDEIRQGGKRRGASLATMQYNHPDIMDFIDSKRMGKELTNFNISVRVDDAFMEAVEKDQEYDLLDPSDNKPTGEKIRAKDVFDRIVENAHLNGEPGLLFYDTINRENPTPHVGSMDATNPCVTGDMLIPTAQGLESMEQLYLRGDASIVTDDRALQFKINGQGRLVAGLSSIETKDLTARREVSFRPAAKFWRKGEKPVYRLTTKSGYSLKATADHRILTPKGWVPLADLTEEDYVFIQPGAGKFNKDVRLPFKVENQVKGKNGRSYSFNFPKKWTAQLGEVVGWLVGDGWLRTAKKEERVGFCFGPDDIDVFSYLKPILDGYYGRPVKEVKRKNDCIHLSYHSRFFAQYFASLGVKSSTAGEKAVPSCLFTASDEAVRGFLRGLFTADGTARFAQGKSAYVRLTSKSLSLLEEVQLLLLNMGIKSSIYNRHRKHGSNFSYNTVSGEKRNYTSDGILFELQISKDSLPLFLQKVGFLVGKKSAVIKEFKGQQYYAHRFLEKVKEITYAGRQVVYDLEEPVTSSFIANGIVVHNCGEQPLLPYESCNLGSINLARMLKKEGDSYLPDWEKLRLTAHIATMFLDRVLDRNKAPIPQIEETMKKNRKIGLGIMGLSQYLIRQEIPYNSSEGFEAAEKIMQEVAVQSKVTSRMLAEQYGNFPNYEGSVWDKLGLPQRNAATTTIAPTGSLSIFANTSPSAEPLFGVGFARNIMDGRYVYVDSVFEEMWLEKTGEELPEEIKEEIGEHGPEGIQKLEKIPQTLRKLFLCAHDIPPADHVRMQAALQKWVDNAVSKTVNAPHEATREDCREVLFQAWRLGAKGITYYRDGSRESQVITSVKDKDKDVDKLKEPRGAVPRGRPETTYGQTTRKLIGFCGRLYVTVNKEITEDGEERVCEVFTSVGEEGCPPLSNALAKIISTSIRAGVDIEEIVDKLREEKCPSCIMHPETSVMSCTDFIGQELAKAVRGGKNPGFRLNAAGGPKGIRMCPSCKLGNMIPDAQCCYCDHCGYSTCG